MKQDIINTNNKGQPHGYQEWHHYHYYNDEIRFRGNYKNNTHLGYIEWHSAEQTQYHIK